MPAVLRTDELLTTAAFRGELERVREMLDHGAVCDARSERLTTALHWASSMGHLEVCALLDGHLELLSLADSSLLRHALQGGTGQNPRGLEL